MNTPSSANPLDRLAQRFDRPAQIIKLVQELDAEDRELARSVVRDLFQAMSESNGSPQAAKGTRRPTKYDLITSMFVREKNPWLTKAEIAEHAGVTGSAVHEAIYGKTKGAILDGPNPAGGRGKAYRLAPQVLIAAQALVAYADHLDRKGGNADDT